MVVTAPGETATMVPANWFLALILMRGDPVTTPPTRFVVV
jgi:hypothetical protein